MNVNTPNGQMILEQANLIHSLQLKIEMLEADIEMLEHALQQEYKRGFVENRKLSIVAVAGVKWDDAS